MGNLCEEIHKEINSLKRYDVSSIDDVPFTNGIYFFFEKGEKFGDYDRIVRIGTDTGQNHLKSRLKQHLVKENKDRSIFIKNIGRAILSKNNNDKLLKYWNLDLTSRTKKDKYFSPALDIECKALEKKISQYMRDNFSFSVIPFQTKEERLRFEEALISALHHEETFTCSKDWLGQYVPATRENHVKESRMWLSQGIDAKECTPEEMEIFRKVCEEERSHENSSNRLHQVKEESTLSR